MDSQHHHSSLLRTDPASQAPRTLSRPDVHLRGAVASHSAPPSPPDGGPYQRSATVASCFISGLRWAWAWGCPIHGEEEGVYAFPIGAGEKLGNRYFAGGRLSAVGVWGSSPLGL